MTAGDTQAHGLRRRIKEHLHVLCEGVDGRLVGTAGNRQATAFVADELARTGCAVSQPGFACLEWRAGAVKLEAGGDAYPAHPGPYSLPFDGEAQLVTAATADELEVTDADGSILLIHGELAAQPLAPRNYVFYNPDEHQRVYRLIDEKQPAAVVAATGICPSTAGAEYPFALFDNGDFDVPSAYLKDVDGERLLAHEGAPVRLSIDSARLPATGCNIIATLPGAGDAARRRIVLTAHVDSRPGTPGALDDASGVATLLAVAELLARGGAGAPGSRPAVEIAILNGEDYYAASGEMAYLAANEGRWDQIAFAVNVDGAGYREGSTAVSFYGCPDALRLSCETALARFPGIVQGAPWVQGDHSLFVMQSVPALAFTSDRMASLWAEVAHTPRDVVELVDPGRLEELALAIVGCIATVG